MRYRTLGLLLPLALALDSASAHEIPSDVTLQVLVHPDGESLRVLVRVPLGAMQDLLFPTTGRGLLDLRAARASGVLDDAAMLWIGENLELYEAGRRLPELEIAAVRVSLPSDRSFSSYGEALAHVTGSRMEEGTQIPWQQAMLDVLFETAIRSERSQFAILPSHARLGLRVVTVLRFLSADGVERAYELGGNPGLVRLDPRWHQAARRFVELGFAHILDGFDHLLFLVCLVVPLRRLRQLVIVVTAFTVAHSLTLIASAFGLVPNALWFPGLVELLIAVSIVYMAFENIVGVSTQRRWLIAFAFGLVHGFGFSFALRDTLQFAGSHLLTSLLSFNLGVELGQLFVLVLLVPLLDLLFRRVVDVRMGTILLSALVAHTAWHWMTERGAILSQYQLGAPVLDKLPQGMLPWLSLVLILAVLCWRGAPSLRAFLRGTDPAESLGRQKAVPGSRREKIPTP